MRKLLRFTIGFAIACAVSGLLLWQKNLIAMIAFSFLSGGICAVIQGENQRWKTAVLVLFGMGMGFSWCAFYHAFYLGPLEKLDGTTKHLHVTVIDYSEKTAYGYSVNGVAVMDGKPYFLRIYQKEDSLLSPGIEMEANFGIRLTTPSGEKDTSYYRSAGCFAIAAQKTGAIYTQSHLPSALFLPSRMANAAQQSIQRCFPADTAPFAKALLLGDTSDLSYEMDTTLKVSGIRHVVAVSGLHVSALFAAIYLVFRRHRWMTFFASVLILSFFAAATGFSPSVTRAVLMAGLMSLGMAIEEEYDGLTSLSFASLVMLVLNPFVICSVSFQLSVSSVAGILIVSPLLFAKMKKQFPQVKPKSKAGKLLSWLYGVISVSIGAQLFSAPFSAYYFGSVSLIGMLTNLLIIWVTPVLFCGVAVVGVLGSAMPWFSSLLGQLLSWPIRLALVIAGILAKIPFAAVYTQSPFIVVWMACFYCGLLVLILFKRNLRIFLAITGVGLAAAITASIFIPRNDSVRLHVLDVGEGQAILIQSKGATYLVDCGGSSDTRTADEIAQTLLSQGISKVDGLILTHYDSDHCNALEYLLTRVGVTAFYLPTQDRSDFASSLEMRYGDKINWIDSVSSLTLTTGTMTFLPSDIGKTSNENSVCVLFESKECVILITGDRSRSGEKELLRNYILPDVDVLIAGHHGSKNATSQELLQAVRPETVIVSVGANNRYGHPARETLDRLAEFGCKVYRTDLEGSVLIRR